MAEIFAIGTQVVPDHDAPAGHGTPWHAAEAVPVALPAEEGTLLAVVPLPGTGRSLAIVGYAVAATALGSRTAPHDEPLDRAGRLTRAKSMDGPGQGSSGSPGPASGPDATEAAGLHLDCAQRRVWVQGAEIVLTFQEFELLAFLTAYPTRVFSRAELVERVWDRDLGYTSRTVDVHVSRLRRKLGPVHGRCLVTEYRVGYQFRPL